MTLSMYEASVPVFVKRLTALDAILAKGAAFAAEKGLDEAELTEARLAPDMLPLVNQIYIATDAVKGVMARLAGIEVPSWPDTEKSFAELRARVATAKAYAESFTADQIDGSEERPVTIKLPNGALDMTGQAYLLHFATPNFYFHFTTAYAIMRSKGVDLGKRDYLAGI